MKKINKDILTWVIIILFFTLIIIAYNQVNNKYTDFGEDAALPAELHPIVEEKKDILLKKASKIGITVIITEKVRSIKQQNELYRQGRVKEGDVVTHAKGGESYHNYGLAFDYALENQEGELIWDIHYDGNNNDKSDWFEVADLAKDMGFTWGGDWHHFKDYPHLQMDFGLSIRQLKNGLRPKAK
ncbi:M15 family metallopeptidase [Virgibacillus oceani]|uniref:Peptidoglycan L-alanyl-D-glutamate endopeptidase CwlK n=1 Tax=Virgibacillus oceani TaxID=1479511 RepID=A0A917M734_9BACI|nr:M15 family metallopeptidase [Virgibacillus oceani]GGG81649.1 peptidoglycan L-alanyl-D-glutamate endopeptidase CwlK [Virgibacillus oceani]